MEQTLNAWERTQLSTEEASREITGLIDSVPLAPELTRAVEKALKQLQQKTGRRPLFLAVRSSAMGEDSEHTFAGQYSSFLNEPQQNLLQRYKDVLASAYAPRPWNTGARKGSPNMRWPWPWPANA